MNYALIFAGGTGQRMNTRTKPKQFLELHGKPVLVYTLEHFENHPDIDGIVLVSLSGWINSLKTMLHRYEITKVKKIVPGGATGHESIYNGLAAMGDGCGEDDIVLIHDGVRPLINEELIDANIAAAKSWGAAITAEPVVESIVQCPDRQTISSVPPRGEMYVAKAPQTFRYRLVLDLYKKAREDGFLAVDSAHLCNQYHTRMHLVPSTPNNMKITAPQDYYIFRALYEAMENQQILGM